MTVAAILAEKGRDVVTLEPDTSVAAAVATLAEHRIGAVVVTEGRQIRGIVSERDVVRAVARHGAAVLDREVRAIMTSEVVTCREDDTIHEVMSEMTRGRFRHLPVTDGGRLTGIVSIGDVVKRRIGDVEREAEEMRAYIATAS
jgi:CBS domain-containing protein